MTVQSTNLLRATPHFPRTPRSALAFLAAIALGAVPAMAQDLTVKAPPQKGAICISNAAIHPISGPDIAKGFIVFRDGVITQVGSGDAPKGAGVTLIDAGGRHVYPGLIGAYTQVGMTEIQSVQASIDMAELGSVTPEVRAATAVNPDSTLIPVTRSNGILTCGVFPTGGVISGQPSVIRMDAWTVTDMTMAPSIGIVVHWPNTRPITAWWMDRSEEDQMKDIRTNLKVITDAFDAAEAYAKSKDADHNAPTDVRWEGMRGVFPQAPKALAGDASGTSVPGGGEAKPGATTPEALPAHAVYILANDLDQITSAVAFASGRHLRLVIVGGRDAPMCADLLKQHEVPVIVVGTHRMPRREDAPYDEAYTLPARLHEAGVTFAIASGDETAHERNLPYAAAMAVAHGLPMDVALRSITLTAAEVLGVEKQVGSLEVGKSATIIVTNGNPLEVYTKIDHAYVDGREIDLTNKQTKLADKYRERYRQMGQLKEWKPTEAKQSEAKPKEGR